jgi:hypothetical protein
MHSGLISANHIPPHIPNEQLMSKKPEQQGKTKPKEESYNYKVENTQNQPNVQIAEQPEKEKNTITTLQEFLELKYSSPDGQKAVEGMILILKANYIFTFADWGNLTKETKDFLCNKTESPIPPVLKQTLDDVIQGNSNIHYS